MGTRPAAYKVIEAARQQLQMSENDLWIASVGCGGYETQEELIAFLRAGGTLKDRDYNAVAAALNDRFIEAGLPPSMPYTEDDG